MDSSEKVRPIESFTFVYKVLALVGFYKHLVKPKSHWKYICHQMYRPVAILITVLINMSHLIYIYQVLALVGFYKHLVKPKSHWKYICHQMYRPVAILITVLINMSHLIYIYQARDDIEAVLEVIMMESPHLQVFTRCLMWIYCSAKFDRIHDALANEPLFLSSNEEEEKIVIEDKRRITNLTKRLLKFVGITAALWTCSLFLKRLQDPEIQIPTYIPFKTDTWPRYAVAAIVYTVFTNPWNVYGNISFDCAIATYYSQAYTQLKMIRHGLERFTRVDDSTQFENITNRLDFQYRDLVDPKIKERFVYIVKKYEMVVRYTKDLEGVLGKSISFGMLTTCVGVCLSIFFMNSTDIPLPLVAFLTFYSMALLSQVFMYCYFGGLITIESDFLNTSIYMSEWYTLSPGFRRTMLIAMGRWVRPLVPKVKSFVVVPLSLGTFIVIVKNTYSLYTVLKAAKNG